MVAPMPDPPGLLPAPRPTGDGGAGFDPRDIASYYAFPAGYDGTGTTIALVSLTGAVRRRDVDAYFSALPGGAPPIEVVNLTGKSGNPPADAALAVSLELLGSVAPGARLAVYVAGDTEQGVLEGLSSAISGSARRADVVCLTWAMGEASVSPGLAAAVHQLMEEAAAFGLPVCAPAGVWLEGNLRPLFPATHPFVLACGATRAVRQGTGLAELPMVAVAGPPSASTLWRAEPWLATATGASAAGRPVPDVSALTGGDAGYRVHLDGKWTSVTAPGTAVCLWAGLLACLRQALGRPWDVTGSLYRTLGPAGCLSAPAWDSRVGWGTPDGERMLAKLSALDLSGLVILGQQDRVDSLQALAPAKLNLRTVPPGRDRSAGGAPLPEHRYRRPTGPGAPAIPVRKPARGRRASPPAPARRGR
jgi:kumamolisin